MSYDPTTVVTGWSWAWVADPGDVNPFVLLLREKAQSMIAPGWSGWPALCGISATLSRQHRHYSQREERIAKVAVITGSKTNIWPNETERRLIPD